MKHADESILETLLTSHIRNIYPDISADNFARKLIDIMDIRRKEPTPDSHKSHWDERDAWLITYGDSIVKDEEEALSTLHHFVNTHLSDSINGIHILPFYPYSSDDGFSVIDYVQVNDGLGDWTDIEALAKDYKVMADLVVNHCSARSRWFENFKNRLDPGKDYFIEMNEEANVEDVVRPRTSPLLKEVETLDGKKLVWCTFSHDQVDLNFANPEMLIEICKIIKYYLDRGIRIFRLDAVAFIWKELGTPCIHLPQTHEIIRLLRTLVEHHSSEAIIITETNVPNTENLSYFGNANEAHAVYNFSLPPLIIQALTSGTSKYLKSWQMTMPPAQNGTFYFNFIASHDGIGLRPAEGIIDDSDIDTLVNCMEAFGGQISWRTLGNNQRKPYEINITLYDALKGMNSKKDNFQLQRFICAHAIIFALEGITAVYIHSFFGTENYYEGLKHTGQNRTINRYKWNEDDISKQISDEKNDRAKVFKGITDLLKIRTKQPAFHPNAVQFTLHISDQIFGFWRQSYKRDQSIFCLHNVSNETVSVPLSSLNLINLDTWKDLTSKQIFDDLLATIELEPYGFVWLTNKIYE